MGLPSWPPQPRPQTFHRLATRCNLLTSETADADDVEDGDVMPDMTSWGYRLLAIEPHRLDEAFGEALSHHFDPGQMVQLGIAIAFLYGLGCLVAAFCMPL